MISEFPSHSPKCSAQQCLAFDHPTYECQGRQSGSNTRVTCRLPDTWTFMPVIKMRHWLLRGPVQSLIIPCLVWRYRPLRLLALWQQRASRPDSCSRDVTPSLMSMWHSPTSCTLHHLPASHSRHHPPRLSCLRYFWGKPLVMFWVGYECSQCSCHYRSSACIPQSFLYHPQPLDTGLLPYVLERGHLAN